jgi:divalent metal cation (Fe/Co/Zn/Cd) transporter
LVRSRGAQRVDEFIAAAITGSSAMLAEGIHSVSDTGNEPAIKTAA